MGPLIKGISLCAFLALMASFAWAQNKDATTAAPNAAKVGAPEKARPAKDAPPAAPATNRGTGADAEPSKSAAPSGSKAAETNPQGAGSVATGWIVSCAPPAASGKLNCEISNSVVITPANQRFVSLAVRRDSISSAELLILTLPHGVLFTSGILAQVDGKEVGRFEPLTSDQQGAYAKMPLTPEATAAIESGETLTVIFDGANSQKFTVGISLAGFVAAHAKMIAEK